MVIPYWVGKATDKHIQERFLAVFFRKNKYSHVPQCKVMSKLRLFWFLSICLCLVHACAKCYIIWTAAWRLLLCGVLKNIVTCIGKVVYWSDLLWTVLEWLTVNSIGATYCAQYRSDLLWTVLERLTVNSIGATYCEQYCKFFFI